MHRGCEGQHGITTIDEPGRARMIGRTAEDELPTTVRPDRRCDGDGPVEEIERAALLDVQFDVDTDPPQDLLVDAEVLGVAARTGQRLGERHPVVVAQPAGAFGAQGTGDEL